MNITIWDNGGKTADLYAVYLGDDVWYMSEDAHMPNGVCMYAGTSTERPEPDPHEDGARRIFLTQLPRGPLVQIIHILLRGI